MESDSAANASMRWYVLSKAVFCQGDHLCLLLPARLIGKPPPESGDKTMFLFFLHTHTHANTHTRTHTYTHTHTHTQTQTHTHTHTHTCTRAHAHNARYPSAKGHPGIKPSTHRWRSAKNTHTKRQSAAPRSQRTARHRCTQTHPRAEQKARHSRAPGRQPVHGHQQRSYLPGQVVLLPGVAQRQAQKLVVNVGYIPVAAHVGNPTARRRRPAALAGGAARPARLSARAELVVELRCLRVDTALGVHNTLGGVTAVAAYVGLNVVGLVGRCAAVRLRLRGDRHEGTPSRRVVADNLDHRCGINNVSSITSVLRPTVAKQ